MRTLYYIQAEKAGMSYLKTSLKGEYEIISLKDPKECFQSIQYLKDHHQQFPEVIIMDYPMSDMSGLHMVESLYEMLPDTHLILLLPEDNEELLFEIIKLGIMDYILKDKGYTRALSSLIAGKRLQVSI
ncbi:response regulator [Rapidithrix thailandica]|uniref:Response regulator n=1 Tax=Rapidithrix thailandica TaxID=413964 RepID=A0AAW9SBZ8_9BACT